MTQVQALPVLTVIPVVVTVVGAILAVIKLVMAWRKHRLEIRKLKREERRQELEEQQQAAAISAGHQPARDPVPEIIAQNDITITPSRFWATLNSDTPSLYAGLWLTNLSVQELNITKIVVTYFHIRVDQRYVDVRSNFVNDSHLVVSAKATQEVFVPHDLNAERAALFAKLRLDEPYFATQRIEAHGYRQGGEPIVYKSRDLTCLGTIDRRQALRLSNLDLALIAAGTPLNGDLQALIERGDVDELALRLAEARKKQQDGQS